MVFDCEMYPSLGKINILSTERTNHPRLINASALLHTSDYEIPRLFMQISDNGYNNENSRTLFIHVENEYKMRTRKLLIKAGHEFGFEIVHIFTDNDLNFLNAIANVDKNLTRDDIIWLITYDFDPRDTYCHIWDIGKHGAIWRKEFKLNVMNKKNVEQIHRELEIINRQRSIILLPSSITQHIPYNEITRAFETVSNELIQYSNNYKPGNIINSWNRMPIEVRLHKIITVEIDEEKIFEFLPHNILPKKKQVELFKCNNGKLHVFNEKGRMKSEKLPSGNHILTCQVAVLGVFSYKITNDFHILLLTNDETHLYDMFSTKPKLLLKDGTFNDRLDKVKQRTPFDDDSRVIVVAFPGVRKRITNTDSYYMDDLIVLLFGYQQKHGSKNGEYYIAAYREAEKMVVKTYVIDSCKIKFVHKFLRKVDNDSLNFKLGNFLRKHAKELNLDGPCKITVFNFGCDISTSNCGNHKIVLSKPKDYKNLLLVGFLDAKVVHLHK